MALRALALACLFALCGLAAACGGGNGSPRGVNVSAGETPFRGCGEARDGIVNEGSEVEPYLTADPRDPQVLVAVYQQDRWSNGKARGIAASYSRDGGEEWERLTLPMSSCATEDVRDPRAGDPGSLPAPTGGSTRSVRPRTRAFSSRRRSTAGGRGAAPSGSTPPAPAT